MAETRMLVTLNRDQIEDIKQFFRRENARGRALTQPLADLALSLDGWIETTTPGDPGRTFMPGAAPSQDHPAARLDRIERRLRNWARDLDAMSPAQAIPAHQIRQTIRDITE